MFHPFVPYKVFRRDKKTVVLMWSNRRCSLFKLITSSTFAFYKLFYLHFDILLCKSTSFFFKLGEIEAYPVPNETQFYDYLGSILYPGRNVSNHAPHKKDGAPSTNISYQDRFEMLFSRGLITYSSFSLAI